MRPRLFSLLLAICCSFVFLSTCFAQSQHSVLTVSTDHSGVSTVPTFGKTVLTSFDKNNQADELVAGLLILLILICVAWYAAIASKKFTKKSARRKAALEAYRKQPWLLVRTPKNTKSQQYVQALRAQEEFSTFLATRSYGVDSEPGSISTRISYASKPYKGEAGTFDNGHDCDSGYQATGAENTATDE